MKKVSVITDSTAFLPKEYLDQYDIPMAPAMILWSGETLLDGVDIQPAEFYSRLSSARELPTTSQATPSIMKAIFEEKLEKGFDILAIYISQKLSGTYGSGVQAKEMVGADNIALIDSGSGAMGAGWLVLLAARAAEAGASLEECKALVENARENVGILLMVDTLEFLHRGGRIGGATRFLGTALKLKPILEVKDGAFEGLERVRTQRKALDRLVDLTIERIAGRSPVRLAVLHANAPQVAAELLEKMTRKIQCIETMMSEVSPGVGVHLGPGTVGAAFLAGVN